MSAFYDQAPFDVRVEWGAEGIIHLARQSRALVIVDVLSFSTAVDIAVGRGAIVYPHGFRDEPATEYAARVGAALAVSRGQESTEQPFSLSPSSLRGLLPGQRLVLPSPNGSLLSDLASTSGVPTYAGCLRNASAVASALRAIGGPVTIVPAGERWSYERESLRPALEDYLGAGAIVAALLPMCLSPEAMAAEAAFRSAKPRLLQTLQECSSGRELCERGFASDVEIAAELHVSDAVPFLSDGAYRA